MNTATHAEVSSDAAVAARKALAACRSLAKQRDRADVLRRNVLARDGAEIKAMAEELYAAIEYRRTLEAREYHRLRKIIEAQA